MIPYRRRSWKLLAAAAGLTAISFVALAACGDDEDAGSDSTPRPSATRPGDGSTDYSSLSGDVIIDGSSTVGPITEAIAEELGKVSNVRATVGISGTGGGFEKFCKGKGETDINDASRPIKDEERAACQSEGVEYVELRVGIDGLTVVVNPSNGFAECLTFSQLRKLWDQGSTVKKWNELDSSFPGDDIELYGPGTDSGTFDYFTETINGKAKQSRADYTASEDDNTLVRGVENDENALGYFGYAYFVEAGSQLTALGIDRDIDSEGTPVATGQRKGCIAPTEETINDGSYPLSRPLYIYVSKDALAEEHVRGFVQYYLEQAPALVADVGYIALSDAEYAAGLDILKAN